MKAATLAAKRAGSYYRIVLEAANVFPGGDTMTPRWWGDGPGVGRWSTETLRREVKYAKAERRERFLLFVTLIGGLLALGVLAFLGRP